MSNFAPTFINPSESDHTLLARIADAVAIGTQNVTAGGNGFDVNVIPSIGNGFPSVKSSVSTTTQSQNLVSVKTGAGLVGSVIISNTNTADAFINFYDSASVTQTAGTISGTPLFCVRALGKNASVSLNLGPNGLNFSTGLTFAFTTQYLGSTLYATAGADCTVIYL